MPYYFPKGMRPSQPEERREFYKKEFDLRKAEKWLRTHNKNFKPILIDVGTETTLYFPELKKFLNKFLSIKYSNLKELSEKLVRYAPEDVYYQFDKDELIFDLDPDNILCAKCSIMKKRLSGKFKLYSFCRNCLNELVSETKDMYNLISKHFSQIALIYSGRGFHMHINVSDFVLKPEEKTKLVEMLKKEYPIDPWVTLSKNLIRLPESLHGLVSRKCIEISLKELDDIDEVINEKAVPHFAIVHNV
jgi:DNA primase catalytic subunit